MMDRMRIARRGAALVVVASLASGLGGCVSGGAYDNATGVNRALSETNTQLQADLDQSRAELAIEKTQRTQLERTNSELRQTVRAQADQLQQVDADFEKFGERMSNMQMIDFETSRALARMARENEGFSYDSSTGVLRFSSDLTFPSGSDQIRDTAISGLKALADVLKSTSAANYEIQIVGHTDSQPISSGTARLHPTNMHLSCHRAISVRKELIAMGVSADRLMAAGWGDQRPLVPNNTKGGTPENRRVEIYLTHTRSSGAIAGVVGSGNLDSARDNAPEINK